MGFKPSKMEDLPLTEKGKQEFVKEGDLEERESSHSEAREWHLGRSLAHSELSQIDPATADAYKKHAHHHQDMYQKHTDALVKLNPENSKLPMPTPSPTDTATNQGHLDYAQSSAKYDDFAPHDFDELLNQPFKPNTNLGGHTLDLTPDMKKHMIELADTLIKAEILLIKNMNNVDFKEKMLYNIKNLRKALE
jgi:hypothetical protein